jgi:glycosyltransferase involved in cell wall biosynthesis
MKVCLVSSFPPSRGDLNEYGYHLARALRDDPRVELTILADETAPGEEETAGFHVERCWRFNSPLNPVRLLRAIRRIRPDVVWFNLGFATLGRTPVGAFMGIAVPALVRCFGYYTHITLHTVIEFVNLKDAGLRFPPLYRVGGRIATHILLLANDVTVLLPSFRSALLKDYGADPERIHFRPHGTFNPPQPNDDASQKHQEHLVLAFGYWGTYKRLELLLAAMDEVAEILPSTVLIVAGGNHPATPGYLESVQLQRRGGCKVCFTGYVPEPDLAELFENAGVMVLPYSSAAGASGVLHQACEYALPIVASDLPEIRELASEEGIAIQFYAPGDKHGLASILLRVLQDGELRRRASTQNFRAAQSLSMAKVVSDYLRLFSARTSRRRQRLTEGWSKVV